MIKRDLSRSIGTLNNEIVEELDVFYNQFLGSDTSEWKEVRVWDCMIKSVVRSANRVFVGPDLCECNHSAFFDAGSTTFSIGRNEEYLDSCVRWTRDIHVSGGILHMFPKFMKP